MIRPARIFFWISFLTNGLACGIMSYGTLSNRPLALCQRDRMYTTPRVGKLNSANGRDVWGVLNCYEYLFWKLSMGTGIDCPGIHALVPMTHHNVHMHLEAEYAAKNM